MSDSHSKDEFLFLDSVRGLAALAVVARHLLLGFYPDLYPLALYGQGVTVQLFFVLSGFVLSLVSARGVEAIRSVAVRRYFRLAVPVTGFVLAAYALHALGLFFNRQVGGPWLGHWYAFEPSLPGAVDEGLFRVFFAYEPARTYNPVLWTMGFEFAGSLLLLGFHAVAGRLRNRALLYAAVAAVLVRLGLTWPLGFLAGAALCDLCGGRPPAGRGSLAGLSMIAAGFVLAGVTPAWVQRHAGDLGPFVRVPHLHKVAGATLLLAGAIHSGWARTAMSARPLLFLGRLSFPLYLAHVPVLCSLGCYVCLVCRDAGYAHGTGALLASMATATASLAAAWAGSLTVEPLSARLGRWVYKNVFAPAPLPAPIALRMPRPHHRALSR